MNLHMKLVLLFLASTVPLCGFALEGKNNLVYLKRSGGDEIVYGSFVKYRQDEYLFYTKPIESELLCIAQRSSLSTSDLNVDELIENLSESGSETVVAFRNHDKKCSDIPMRQYGSIRDGHKRLTQYQNFLSAFKAWQKTGNSDRFTVVADEEKQECFRKNESLNIYGFTVDKDEKYSAEIDGCLNELQADWAEITVDKKGAYKIKLKFQLPPYG